MDTISKVKRQNQKIVTISWDEFDMLMLALVDELKNVKFILRNIYAIPRGGYIPAVVLSHKLNLPFVEHRHNITKRTLVVDDIKDSGKTIDALQEYKPQATFAYLHNKDNKTTHNEFYVKTISKDKWVKYPWEQ